MNKFMPPPRYLLQSSWDGPNLVFYPEFFAGTFQKTWLLFFAPESWQDENAKFFWKVTIITNLSFQTIFLQNHKLGFFHQSLNWQLFFEEGYSIEKHRNWSLCRNCVNSRRPKSDTNFDISVSSNSYFSMTFELGSSIKVLYDSFLSTKGSSTSNSVIVPQVTDFSWQTQIAEIADVFVFFCRFSNSNFSKASVLNSSHKVSIDNGSFSLAKIICYKFNQSCLHPVDRN